MRSRDDPVGESFDRAIAKIEAGELTLAQAMALTPPPSTTPSTTTTATTTAAATAAAAAAPANDTGTSIQRVPTPVSDTGTSDSIISAGEGGDSLTWLRQQQLLPPAAPAPAQGEAAAALSAHGEDGVTEETDQATPVADAHTATTAAYSPVASSAAADAPSPEQQAREEYEAWLRERGGIRGALGLKK